MKTEVEETIAGLLGPDSSGAERKAALQRLGEILEEDYILNLPPNKSILGALEALGQQTGVVAALKGQAKQLNQRYRI